MKQLGDKMNFSDDNKYKIWLDYVVTISALNNFSLMLETNKYLDSTWKNYQILGVSTKIIENKHKICEFDVFCETHLLDWYFKFSDRIKI